MMRGIITDILHKLLSENESSVGFEITAPSKNIMMVSIYNDDGVMVGDAKLEFRDGLMVIHQVEIIKKFRKSGYAKLLMDKIIKLAKSKSASNILLVPEPMDSYGMNRYQLINFYGKYGFTDAGHGVMSKPLNEVINKLELVDIDDDELYDSLEAQANELRSNSEISFGSADPFEILYDDETGKLVGATWIETSGAFSPHMIIKPEYRKLGLSKQLIDGVVEKYKKMKQLRGGDYIFMLNVVNKSLADTMEQYYGFKKLSEDPHGNITMTL